MSSEFSFSPSVVKPSRRFGSIRAPWRRGLHRCVLGLFVVAWLMGGAGGKPCCCQASQAASPSLANATEKASAARAKLPPCCVQHAIAESRHDACGHATQPCADGLQSLAVDGLNCDCHCCISSDSAAVLP